MRISYSIIEFIYYFIGIQRAPVPLEVRAMHLGPFPSYMLRVNPGKVHCESSSGIRPFPSVGLRTDVWDPQRT